MPEKKFKYADPRFLNQLAVTINREKCELCAGLHPNVPEFIKAVVTHDRKVDYYLRNLSIRALCETHNILPFWSLAFRGDLEPMIEYAGPKQIMDEALKFRKACEHPGYFSMNRKWFSITFDRISGNENVGKAQAAIQEFTKSSYLVTRVEAHLNPYTVSGDHCAYRESKAHLWASDGEVFLKGDFSDDFDIQDLIQKQLPLPGFPPIGLEEFLKI